MKRCLELAATWKGFTGSNPLVGAVLVHQDRIIGEGAHQQYGGPHAEVHCLQSVAENDKHLIPESTLYVSLEPCAHYGKTPPCSLLIVQHKIPKVVIAARDPFDAVNGKGMEHLKEAGIEVISGILEQEAIALNAPFFCFHRQKKPYIILKWAQTANGVIGGTDPAKRLLISNESSNRLVHQWRRDCSGILIGTQTAIHDDPELNNRYWPGPSPLKIILDLQDRIPPSLRLFQNGKQLIITARQKEASGSISYVQVDPTKDWVHQLLPLLHKLNIQSVLVEGGKQTLQTFIDRKCWDEIRIITNTSLQTEGLKAPELPEAKLVKTERMGTDQIDYYIH